MAWIVGIDEAGYGPNLGPFVMSMVVFEGPDLACDRDLWKLLCRAVRRHGDAADHRLLVADSKRIHDPARGIGPLEEQTLPWVCDGGHATATVEHLWSRTVLTPIVELRRQPWFREHWPIPQSANAEECLSRSEAINRACAQCGLILMAVRVVFSFPSAFNALLKREGTKAAIPQAALGELLAALEARAPTGEVRAVVDKQGGRNFYHAMLQGLLADRMIWTLQESPSRSTYRFRVHEGECTLRFEPEADGNHFAVALASMLSKYWREVLMAMFNRFWQERIPQLKPTAGYPTDARRFAREIATIQAELGIPEDVIWRHR